MITGQLLSSIAVPAAVTLSGPPVVQPDAAGGMFSRAMAELLQPAAVVLPQPEGGGTLPATEEHQEVVDEGMPPPQGGAQVFPLFAAFAAIQHAGGAIDRPLGVVSSSHVTPAPLPVAEMSAAVGEPSLPVFPNASAPDMPRSVPASPNPVPVRPELAEALAERQPTTPVAPGEFPSRVHSERPVVEAYAVRSTVLRTDDGERPPTASVTPAVSPAMVRPQNVSVPVEALPVAEMSAAGGEPSLPVLPNASAPDIPRSVPASPNPVPVRPELAEALAERQPTTPVAPGEFPSRVHSERPVVEAYAVRSTVLRTDDGEREQKGSTGQMAPEQPRLLLRREAEVLLDRGGVMAPEREARGSFTPETRLVQAPSVQEQNQANTAVPLAAGQMPRATTLNRVAVMPVQVAEIRRPESDPLPSRQPQEVVTASAVPVVPELSDSAPDTEQQSSGGESSDKDRSVAVPQPGRDVLSARSTHVRTTFEHGAASLTVPADLPPQEQRDQLVRQLAERMSRYEVRDGVDRITVRVNPEHLGQVQLHFRMDNHRLQVEVMAENRQTRDALVLHSETLREALSRQNIIMESFDVSTGGRWSGSSGQESQQWRELARQRQQTASWMPSGRYRDQAQLQQPPPEYGFVPQRGMVDLHF